MGKNNSSISSYYELQGPSYNENEINSNDLNLEFNKRENVYSNGSDIINHIDDINNLERSKYPSKNLDDNEDQLDLKLITYKNNGNEK